MKENTTFKLMLTAFFSFAFSLSLFAQHWTFYDTDDARQRGYYDRPYKRYEAEPDWSQKGGNAVYLPPTFDQREVQSEASNQQAVQLINVGDYVEWINSEAADGMVIRFSIPDNAAGTGTTGTLALYVNNVFVKNIELNSYWAWQYILRTGNQKYPYNVPSADKFPRMRFDDVRVTLNEKIPAGASFKLEKADASAGAYTIDFVELEPIPAVVPKPTGADVVEYTGDGSDLRAVLLANEGKTIYIPAGYYEVPVRLQINGNGSKLIGAGMWHTQLHFTAEPTNTISDPNNPLGYNARGIRSIASNVEVSGLYLTTANERRYQDYASIKKMGEGFNGSFGTNSKISDVWVTHFECGAWIEGANGLSVKTARFRNNYADGINLARGSKNSIVEYSSFRNNGDDDMASWSNGNVATENNTFQYNTSENCWRAAAIGFFGGKQNKALNCVITDPLESGVRFSNDFNGAPFSNEGYFQIRDISIYRAGDKQGEPGQSGSLWGHRAPAIFINSSPGTGPYDVQNLFFSNIDIYDSGGDAILVKTSSNWAVKNVTMENITVNRAAISTSGNNWDYYGLFLDGNNGVNNLFCINFQNMGNIPEANFPLPVAARGFLITSDCAENIRIIRAGESIDLNFFIPENFTGNTAFSILEGNTNVSVNQGIVTGLMEGTAKIQATDNAQNSIIYNIIVREVAVLSVSITEETLTLRVGEQYALTPIFVPSNATNKVMDWQSSNTAATVINGRITAKAVGTATITGTTRDGGYTVNCVVTVINDTSDTPVPEDDKLVIAAYGNEIQISGYSAGETISIYNLLGVNVYSQQLIGESAKIIRGIREGVYVVTAEKSQKRQKVMIRK